MVVLNNQLILKTEAQLKRINIVYILALVASGLLLIPIINMFLGISTTAIFLGLLIYLHKEVKKHYKDSLLLTAVWIAAFGFVINILQIRIIIMRKDLFLANLIGLVAYVCVLSACIFLIISLVQYSNEYRKFKRMQFYPDQITYDSKILPVALDANIIYEQRDRNIKDFISFIFRAIVMVFIYFGVMENILFVGDVVLIPFQIFIHAIRNNVGLNAVQFKVFAVAWMNVYIQLICVTLGMLLFFKEIRYIFRKMTKSTVAIIFIGYGSALLIKFIVTLLLHLLNINLPVSGNQTDLNTMQKVAPMAIVLATILLAPITEEFVFRQGLAEGIYRLFEKVNYQATKWIQDIIIVVAIIVSGSIFGFIHVMNHGDYIAVVPYLVSGLVYTAFYFYNGRNVVATIGMHMLNNFVATVTSL